MTDAATKHAPPSTSFVPKWRNRYLSDRAFTVQYGNGVREKIPAGEFVGDDEHDTEALAEIAAEDWLKTEPEDDSLPLCAFVRWLGAVPTVPPDDQQE